MWFHRGVFNKNGGLRNYASGIVEAGRLLSHRGVDDDGSYFDDHAGFYFRRLSIIDLSDRGHQPFISDDGALVLVYNGEIYNYKELRTMLEGKGYRFVSNSDTEVLMKAYQEFGDDSVNYFRGMFAFAIWNKKLMELSLFRDRFGIKPLYVYNRKNQVVIASEIKSILHFAPESKIIDERTSFKFLARNFADDTTDTFFSQIKAVEPATMVKIKASGTNRHKYWTLKYDENNSFDLDSFLSVFEDTISMHVRSDVPVAATLSGGMDSTSIVGTITKCCSLNEKLKTYSVCPPDTFDETFWINKSIEYTGVEHEYVDLDLENLVQTIDEIIIKHDEPFQYSSCVFHYLLRKSVAERNIKVLLVGEGADEVMAGYKRIIFQYLLTLYGRKEMGEFLRALRGCSLLMSNKPVDKILDELLNYERVSGNNESGQENLSAYDLLNSSMAREYQDIVNEPLYVSVNGNSEESFFRLLQKHIFVRNVPFVLRMEDRNSMANGIEARVPYLDHVFVEMVFSHHFSEFMKDGMNKSMLRRSMKGYVPDDVLQRMSKTNRPGNHANLVYKQIGDEIFDILHSSASGNHFFNDNLRDKFKEDLSRYNIASAEIWFRIYVFERWRRLLNI